MWFRSGRKFQRLERHLARVEQQISALTHAVANGRQPASPDLTTLLQAVTSGQASQIESVSGFIRTISDVATERMAAALGKRGGKKRASTAARDARGRMLPNRERSDCPLCQDASTADFSVAEFEEHQRHKGRRGERYERRQAAERTEYIETQAEHVHHEHEHHNHGPSYPLPAVTLPNGDPAGGTGGDSSESPSDAPEQQTNGALIS